MTKLLRRACGVVFLVVVALLATLAVQVYQKKFVTAVMVTLRTDRLGNQLRENAEVKARGVVVGEVRAVHIRAGGADLRLALDSAQISHLPKDVAALLVPKTLFGQRYVQLSIPEHSTAGPLAAGDVISQDRSANAIELEKVFDDLLPVLQAVQPQKLAATLTAVATAIDGRGGRLGDTLVIAARYLEEFNPNLPQVNDDIRDLAKVSDLYGDISPDLLDSLTDAAVTLNTISEKNSDLNDLYVQVTSSAQEITTFLRNNKDIIIRLTGESRKTLELTARYAPSFPCTLEAMNQLRPSLDKAFGAGTGKPGLHIEATVTEPRGKYVPGKDDPVYSSALGPRCYPSGVAPHGGIPGIPGIPGTPAPVADDLGLANSPQEQELISTLVAPQVGGDVPAWSSVLVGALYRGAEVNVS